MNEGWEKNSRTNTKTWDILKSDKKIIFPILH